MSTKTKDTPAVVVSELEAETLEISATQEVETSTEVSASPEAVASTETEVSAEAPVPAMVMSEPTVITGLDFGSDETIDLSVTRNVRFLRKKHKYFADVNGIKCFFTPVYQKDVNNNVVAPGGVARVRGLQCGLVLDILGAEVMMDSIYIQRNDNGSFFWIMGDGKQQISAVLGDTTYTKEVTNVSATGQGDTAKYFQEARFQKLTPKSERFPDGGSISVVSVNLTNMAPQLWKVASSVDCKPIA